MFASWHAMQESSRIVLSSETASFGQHQHFPIFQLPCSPVPHQSILASSPGSICCALEFEEHCSWLSTAPQAWNSTPPETAAECCALTNVGWRTYLRGENLEWEGAEERVSSDPGTLRAWMEGVLLSLRPPQPTHLLFPGGMSAPPPAHTEVVVSSAFLLGHLH